MVYRKQTRGKKNGKAADSGAIDSVEPSSGEQDADLRDLITKEDKELLQGIDSDDDEVIVLTEDCESVDVNPSEISNFLQELGIDKFRPFSGSVLSYDSEEMGKQKKLKVKEKQNESGVKNVNGIAHEKSKGENKQTKTVVLKKEKKKKENLGHEGKMKEESKLEDSGILSKMEQSAPMKLTDYSKFMKSHKFRKTLLLKPEDIWYDEQTYPLPTKPFDAMIVAEAEELSKKLLEDEIALYMKQRQNTNRSEAQWLKTVLASGTLPDKMAALTLLVQESPVHNMASIDTLLSMAAKKGRREATLAIDTLRELFLTGLLPDDRKLKTLPQRPLLDLPNLSEHNVEKRDTILLKWHFEHLLKERYTQFIKTLRDMTFDSVTASKEKAITAIQILLTKKPEQENVLLPILVNKLGDTNIKSKASHLLSKLVKEHPQMNAVVVKEIERLLYRPNVSTRAQYYAICFLTQIRLNEKQSALATEMIQLYFLFFQSFLKMKDVDSKMLSALLTGVNRAYVYASDKKENILQQMDDVYKLIPSVNFNTGVQALMLLFHVTKDSVADRFYMCLYRKLADPELRQSSKQAIFLNLLFRSLKRDLVDRRIQAFTKRILQVYSHHPPQVLCGVLILLSQILEAKPGLLNVTHREEVVWGEEEEEKFVDLPVPEDFEHSKTKVDHSDVEDEDTAIEGRDSKDKVDAASFVKGTWDHRVNKHKTNSLKSYDPLARNPLYNRAEADCTWELEELVNHYHPTVNLYAQKLLKGETIDYEGNPLSDFTLIRFLDRFVFKNPKKNNKVTDEGAKGKKQYNINSKEFLNQGEKNVPESERFFFKYFKEKAKKSEKKKEKEESDNESVDDKDFDAYLDEFEDNMDKDTANDLEINFASGKAKSKGESDIVGHFSDNDEFDDDEEFDVGDDDLAKEFEEELQGLGSGQGEGMEEDEEPDFSPDENDELQMMMAEDMKSAKKGKKRKNKNDLQSLFASADEFAEALEDDADTGDMSVGTSHQFKNSDKAGTKQLMWEERRDKWMRDTGPISRKRKFTKAKTQKKEQRGKKLNKAKRKRTK